MVNLPKKKSLKCSKRAIKSNYINNVENFSRLAFASLVSFSKAPIDFFVNMLYNICRAREKAPYNTTERKTKSDKY